MHRVLTLERNSDKAGTVVRVYLNWRQSLASSAPSLVPLFQPAPVASPPLSRRANNVAVSVDDTEGIPAVFEPDKHANVKSRLVWPF